jgi:hypothetical protein
MNRAVMIMSCHDHDTTRSGVVILNNYSLWGLGADWVLVVDLGSLRDEPFPSAVLSTEPYIPAS